MSEQAQVIFSQQGAIGFIRLNRPKNLNALSHKMILEMTIMLRKWEKDKTISAVIIEGAGEKAFCAGGDIVELYNNSKQDPKRGQQFLRDEYQLNATIGHYKKPYIAIMDGITMGGGVGVSSHGTVRIVSERTIFAMPEVIIGFLPDVGSTYLLSRALGKIGLYLGMIGARIGAADVIYAGFADNYIHSDRLEDFCKALVSGMEKNKAIEKFSSKPEAGKLEQLQNNIDDAFGKNSVLECKARLSEMSDRGNDWATTTLTALSQACPVSVMATFEIINNAKDLSLNQCLQAEYRFAHKALLGNEFYEGIRAAVIDKDKSPKWQPASLEQVAPEMVQQALAPIGKDEWIAQ